MDFSRNIVFILNLTVNKGNNQNETSSYLVFKWEWYYNSLSRKSPNTDPANICLDEDVLKTSSRRLDQDEYGRFSLTSSEEDALALHLLQDVLKNAFKTSSRRLQDVFKTYHQVKLFFLTRL